jgi:hypothetical protein
MHGADALAATRHVVVLLRLTVGTGGRILHGEVVDPETSQSRSFHGLAGLPTVLRRWLEAAAATEASADERPTKATGRRAGPADPIRRREPEDPCLPS